MLRARALRFDLNAAVIRIRAVDEIVMCRQGSLMRFFDTIRAKKASVDEDWYLSSYPDVRAAVEQGHVTSGESHYRLHGYREGRLPVRPNVDESWYLLRYPDVREAIRRGQVKSAYDHFLLAGFGEGRLPQHPSESARKK
jgi:hypothetical protein